MIMEAKKSQDVHLALDPKMNLNGNTTHNAKLNK